MWLAGRVSHLITVLLGTSLAVFAMMWATPGDPVQIMLADQRATPAQVAALRHEMGLDLSMPHRFVLFVWHALHGDFGRSFFHHRPVIDVIGERLPATIELTLAAAILALLIGIPLGLYAGTRRVRLPDRIVSLASLIGVSMPGFWLGLLLMLVFSVTLHLFPVSGQMGSGDAPPAVTHLMVLDSLIAGRPDMALTALRHLALPAITLALPMAAVLMQVTRTAAMEVHARRLHHLRRRQGSAAPSHPVSPCAEKRAGTRRQRRCDRDRRHARRQHDRGDHLLLARRRPSRRRGHFRPQLSARSGRRPALRRLLRPPELRRRPALSRSQPARRRMSASLALSPGTLAVRHFRRDPLAFGCALFLLAVAIIAITAPVIAPHDPADADLLRRLQPPVWISGGDWSYPLGCDGLGRDILSRLIYGARISLGVGVFVVALATVIGVTLGVLAGFVRGLPDALLSRIADVLLGFPYLVFAIGLMGMMGPGLFNIIITLVLKEWVVAFRVARGETLAAREQDYVEAARAIGCRRTRIMRDEVMPNILSPVLVVATIRMANVIIMEASLSFLGLGVQPPSVSWGGMVADGRDVLADGWWVSTFPGLAIMLVVIATNLASQGLREAFDPRLSSVTSPTTQHPRAARALPDTGRSGRCRKRRGSGRASGRVPGRRRRIRLGQKRHLPRHARTASIGNHQQGRHRLEGQGPRPRDTARAGDRANPAERADRAEPGAADRHTDRGNPGRPSPGQAPSGPRDHAAAPGRNPRSGPSPARLSARTLGRDAPARDDRRGASPVRRNC